MPDSPAVFGRHDDLTKTREGAAAHKAGTAVTDCPYNRASADLHERLAAKAWIAGWVTAWRTTRAAARAPKGPLSPRQ